MFGSIFACQPGWARELKDALRSIMREVMIDVRRAASSARLSIERGKSHPWLAPSDPCRPVQRPEQAPGTYG